MYKLIKGEGLYLVSNNHYIVANQVEVTDDKIICRHETNFRGKTIVTDKEYKLGEVGIFWQEDVKDLCSRPLDVPWDIFLFHQSLYENDFWKDDPNDFADFADVPENKVYAEV